jgi:transcription factor S
MEFCPNCGSMLMPQKTSSKVAMTCPKCGYVLKDAPPIANSKVGTKVITHSLQQQVTVVSKADEVDTMPTMRMECPKCSNMIVYVWQVQTRGGDEAMTQFFRCTKCNHTFREYS